MGNCISKISKGCLFAFEEFLKNKTSLEKGRVRPGLERLTGGTNMRIYSIKGLSKKRNVGSITNWDVVEKPFFTHPVDRWWFFLHCEMRGWHVFCIPPLRILGLFCTLVSLLSLLPKFKKPASNKNDRVY